MWVGRTLTAFLSFLFITSSSSSLLHNVIVSIQIPFSGQSLRTARNVSLAVPRGIETIRTFCVRGKSRKASLSQRGAMIQTAHARDDGFAAIDKVLGKP